MKLEKFRTSLAGVLLSLSLSCGAVGCLLTGFDLNVADVSALWLVCGVTALICGIAFRWKWGGTAVLCLLALGAGYLWHRGEAGQQILQLIYRISYGYDQAYDCGVLRFVDTPWNMGMADIPLQILGCVISVIGCHTVCRGKRTWPAVTAALIPLLLCLVVTDTVPEEAFLFVLLLGLTMLLLTASVRRLDPEQAGKLLWILVLPVAAAMTLLFHSIPQDGYVNQSKDVREEILTWVESLPEQVEDATREIATAVQYSEDETVNLKTLGRQSSLAYPVMEVTSDRGGTLYLRGQDYDSYTGTGWTATPHRSEEFTYAGDQAGSVKITTRSGWENRFLPYYPGESQPLVGGSLDNPGKAKSYQVPRNILPHNWRVLVQERSEGHWESDLVFATVLEATNYLDSARYLLLPVDTQRKAEELLKTILEDPSSATATAKADAIAAYVRSSAEYDRDTGRMPADEEDFALWFLEDSDTGYCVHFATAAVVLLRAADVPARYVTGYMVTCQPGETVTVTADTAHAWAEYYEPQLACWIPLEATPADGLPQTVRTEETTEASRPSQTPQTQPAQTEPAYSYPIREETPGTEPAPQPEKRTISFGWLWLLMIPGALTLQRPVRIALRRRRFDGAPNDRALGYWQEILLLAKLQKSPVPRALKELAQKAKFSQHTLTEEELAQMERYIHDSVDNLKQEPWYLRLLYRYFFAAW